MDASDSNTEIILQQEQVTLKNKLESLRAEKTELKKKIEQLMWSCKHEKSIIKTTSRSWDGGCCSNMEKYHCHVCNGSLMWNMVNDKDIVRCQKS